MQNPMLVTLPRDSRFSIGTLEVTKASHSAEAFEAAHALVMVPHRFAFVAIAGRKENSWIYERISYRIFSFIIAFENPVTLVLS